MNEEEKSESEDAQLIERARAGDPAAFEEIFLRHRNQIYSLSYRMTGNAADAEDLCQDVFVVAMRKIGSFQGRSSFSTWLYRVAVNRSKDFLRKRKRTPEVLHDCEMGELGPSEEETYKEREIGPEGSALQAEAQKLVMEALAQLPESLRAPLVLHELQGFEYSEVASLLRIPVGTVKSRIFRARLKMADILEPHKEHWST